MKTLRIPITVILCLILLLGGCSGERTHNQSPQSAAITKESIDEWPENFYTYGITPPAYGIPNYTILDENAGYYAIFIKDITREEGEQYINGLIKQEGWNKIAENDAAASLGISLQKNTVILNISVSDHELGIYIAI